MSALVTIGSTSLIETPDSPIKNKTIDGTTYTLKYQGVRAACEAGEPDIGDLVTGFPSTHAVTETTIANLPGGQAQLTVTLKELAYSTEAITPESPDYNYSLQVSALAIPLERHPYYATSGSHSDFTDRLDTVITLDAVDGDGLPISGTPSTDEWDIDVPIGVIWDMIKRLPLREARILYLRVPTANRPILTDIWKEWVTGQDEVNLYVPSGRVSDSTLTRPDVGDFGKTVTPPSGLGWPSGFQCLRNGGAYNRPKKTGRYRREIEYLGAPSFKAKFYPPA